MRRQRPVLVAVLALAVLALALAATLPGLLGGSAAPSGPTAAQLIDYETAALPTLKDWGSVEIRGMQPAVADLVSGTGAVTGSGLPRASVVGESRAWVSALTLDRDKLARLPVPPGLAAAAADFDAGLVSYLEAATMIGQAAAIDDPAQRMAVLQEAVATAKRGDAAYNRAAALIQASRRALGLGANSNLPDPAQAPGVP